MIKKINRFLFKNNLSKPLRYIYIIGFYIASIWVIETMFDISLFVKLASLFGVVKFLEKI